MLTCVNGPLCLDSTAAAVLHGHELLPARVEQTIAIQFTYICKDTE